ncbi:MAG TPA: acyl-CoA desaturase [Actinomycetota bacterium]|nr:acyl-CoA desaturase [Actinomycetota bacterium]
MSVASAERVPGVVVLTPRQTRLHQFALLSFSIVPLIGVGLAIWSLWGRGLSGTDAAIFGGMYASTGLGVSAGFHRLFAHKTYRAKAPARIVLAVAGSMSIEMGVIKWAATHRRHHAFADRPGDPHSPHLDAAQGLKGIARGLWFAHMGWLLTSERTDPQRWAPDLLKDPALRWIDRAFPLWVALSVLIPPALGLAITGSWAGAATAFLWGSLVRIFLLHHVTFSINSICHFFGKRPYDTKEESRNVWPLAFISFGEAWHNNHHAFPASSSLGLRWWQVDPGTILIRGLRLIGLADDLRRPSVREIRQARAG